ncbi:MAG: GatB/YqeY domain-containing protein [Desulfohalobiaceae bacterium]
MTLQVRIQERLHVKGLDKKEKDALRVVVGELQRQKSKELSDQEVTQVLRKLINSEKEMGQRQDQDYIQVLESFLPQEATDQEIVQWIQENVDFSGYSNKMQAMREILSHFGSRADGNRIKKILNEEF